jgi:F-type H+-transporting ATPase subunit b
MLSTLLLAAESEVTAKNPIIPETKEIIWAAIAFLIVFTLLAWKAWPAIKKALQDREDRVRADLERAEAARTEAESQLGDYQRQLAEARAEAGRIIEEARQAADQVRKDLMAKAEADAAELRGRAGDDIKLATDRALADLQSRVADLSIELAEKVVEKNLDRETQIQLIENYINQVGSK